MANKKKPSVNKINLRKAVRQATDGYKRPIKEGTEEYKWEYINDIRDTARNNFAKVVGSVLAELNPKRKLGSLISKTNEGIGLIESFYRSVDELTNTLSDIMKKHEGKSGIVDPEDQEGYINIINEYLIFTNALADDLGSIIQAIETLFNMYATEEEKGVKDNQDDSENKEVNDE